MTKPEDNKNPNQDTRIDTTYKIYKKDENDEIEDIDKVNSAINSLLNPIKNLITINFADDTGSILNIVNNKRDPTISDCPCNFPITKKSIIKICQEYEEEKSEMIRQHHGLQLKQLLEEGLPGTEDAKNAIRNIITKYLGREYFTYFPPIYDINSLFSLYRKNSILANNPFLRFEKFTKAEEWVFHASRNLVEKLTIDLTNLEGFVPPPIVGVINNIFINWPYAYWIYICDNFPKLKEIVIKVDNTRKYPELSVMTIKQKEEIRQKLIDKNLTKAYIPTLDLYYE